MEVLGPFEAEHIAGKKLVDGTTLLSTSLGEPCSHKVLVSPH